jgi:hypothetical protein
VVEPVEAPVGRFVTPQSTPQGEVAPPGKYRRGPLLFFLFQPVLPCAFLLFFLFLGAPRYTVRLQQRWEHPHVRLTRLAVLVLIDSNPFFLTQQPLCKGKVELSRPGWSSKVSLEEFSSTVKVWVTE